MGMVEPRNEEVPGMQNSIFQTLFDNSSDAMLLLDGSRFVDCNPAALKLLRTNKAELTQLGPDQISPAVQPDGSDSQQKSEEMIGLALENGNHTFEWLHHRLDGSEFYAEVNLTPVPYGDRQVVLVVLRDITQRKQIEQDLKQSEELYRTLFNTQQDGAFLLQGDMIVAANATVAEMTGYSQDELLTLPFLQVVAPEDRAAVSENYRKRLAGESIWDENLVHLLRKDGETRMPVMLRDHTGTYQDKMVVMGSVRNMTEKLRIENELRESQQRLELFISSSPVVMFVINTEGVFTLSEGRGLADLGLKPGQVVGMSVYDVYRDAPIVIEEVRQALQGENLRSVSQVGPLWFETVYAPIHDDQGKLVGTIGISTNVTENKQAQEETERLVSIFEAANDFIGTADLNGRLLYLNKAARRMINIAEDADISNLYIPDTQPQWSVDLLNREAFPQVFKTGLWSGEVAFLGEGGREIPVSQTIMAHRNANGEVQYFSTIARDISERKQFEQQLQEMVLRRGYQVQVSTEIAQEIASATALGDLFNQVVTLVKERIGYYHTQILRYDPAQNAVVLIAGYGETGQRMLAARHRVELGRGLIGVAAATGQTVLRSDTRLDPDWRSNPLLPDTLGEVAVPIKYGENVLGVLDVQSNQAGALTDDDRLLLEGLCGQIAIAIEGTLLRQQMEERLNELNALYRSTSQEGWKNFREVVDLPSGFIYDQVETRSAQDVWVDEIEQAIRENRLAPASSTDSAAVTPLSVRGEVIGALGIYEDPDRPLNDQEKQLIEQVSDQVALALESARLFEQTRIALGETEEHAQRLTALNEMSDLLNKAGDAHEAMAVACQKTLDILHGDRASVALLDPSSDTFEVYALMGLQSMIPQGKHLPVNGTAIGLAMRENRVVQLPADGDMENYMEARMLAQQGIHSTMSAPLMAGTHVIGTLNIASANASAFDESDRILITQLSAVLASTIENRRLFERIQGALIATEKQYNFTRRLAEAKDLQEVLVSAVEAFGVGDINRAVLYTFDIDQQNELTGVLVKAVWHSSTGNLPLQEGVYYNDEATHRIFSNLRVDQPLFIDETEQDVRQQGIFSAVVLPLWVGARQIGAVVLQATETQHSFSDEEKRPVPSLTQQIAIAIQSRLLFEETQASEARFRSISGQLSEALAIARMGYFDYDLTNNRFTLTDQFYHTLGTTAEEQGGYELSIEEYSSRFLDEEGAKLLTEKVADALQAGESGSTIQIEHPFRRPDGSFGHLTSRYQVMKDETGTTIRVFGASQDISERKAVEETLDSQRRTLQAVLDNMPAGVFMVEAPSGRPILTNKQAEDFLGRGISPTAIGDDLNEVYQAYKFGTDELYPPEEMPVVAGLYGKAKTISDMEVRKPDGSRSLLEVAGTPVYDASGNLFASVVVFQDITEKQLAQQVLESQRRTLQAVLDNMPAGVFMVEAPSGRPILTNKRAEDFLGRGISPTAIGEDLNEIYQAYRYGTEELYPPADMPVVAGLYGQAKTISDMEVRKPDGSRVLLEINGAPVFNDNGAIIASVVVFTDITERRRLEDTILQERAQLADALDAARMGNWEFDLNSGNFIFNDRFYEFLGTTAEAEGGYEMPAPVFASKFVHPDDQAIVGANVQAAIESSDPHYSYEGLSRQVLANGDVRDVIVRFSIKKDEQGRTIRLFGANQDVTEQRRAEATIAKRAVELATVSQVSTTVATILSPDEMLQTVVDLTKASFSLYHTHIYLLNEQGSQLLLAKGAGEVGRRMVGEGRSIGIDTEQSLVARAARTRQGVIVNDIRQNPDFLPHPLLPETRSEMAVPLIVGDTLLGVMDIQSDEVNRFSQEDVSIMTTLGAQVAVSLQNARSYARAQRQAERESLINAISERIQSTNSVEDALQVAVRELGRALGAQHTSIRLGLERKGGSQ